jgi:hypothetical protein
MLNLLVHEVTTAVKGLAAHMQLYRSQVSSYSAAVNFEPHSYLTEISWFAPVAPHEYHDSTSEVLTAMIMNIVIPGIWRRVFW